MFENCTFQITTKSLRGQWVKRQLFCPTCSKLKYKMSEDIALMNSFCWLSIVVLLSRKWLKYQCKGLIQPVMIDSLMQKGRNSMTNAPELCKFGRIWMMVLWLSSPLDGISIHLCWYSRTQLWSPIIGLILWMHLANERQRYNVTSSLIGWAHSKMIPILWHNHSFQNIHNTVKSLI